MSFAVPSSINNKITNKAALSGKQIARSSILVFMGTFISRGLGFIRNALLIALIGGRLANDAFQTANLLPNTIFNILAGGVLNAILVPQIVRLLRNKNSQDGVNRLLSIAGSIVLAITVIVTIFASITVNIFAVAMSQEWKALAVALAFWCLPQIFFYGLYSLWGQLLSSQGNFSPYTWAPVFNNITGIIALIIFWFLFGRTEGTDINWWTTPKIIVLGAGSTLGVIVQAFILLLPLYRSNFRLRFRFQLRGYGLGKASKVASWAFASLLLGQLSYISAINVVSTATQYAQENNTAIAATTAYANAFMIYMLPQSLITTSIITVIFTRFAALAADKNYMQLAKDYSLALRTISIFTLLSSILMFILAPSIIRVIAPTVEQNIVMEWKKILALFSLGIVFQGIISINQRIFFVFDDTRRMFFSQIPSTIVNIILIYSSLYLLEPHNWVQGIAAAEAISLLINAISGFIILRQIHIQKLYSKLLKKSLLRLIIAGLISFIIGKLCFNYLNDLFTVTAKIGKVFVSLSIIILISALVSSVYFLVLLILRTPELWIFTKIFPQLTPLLYALRKDFYSDKPETQTYRNTQLSYANPKDYADTSSFATKVPILPNRHYLHRPQRWRYYSPKHGKK